MKIAMTGDDEWEFAITGIDRRTMVLLACATKHYRDHGSLKLPEDWGRLDAADDAMTDVLYPIDAEMTFGESEPQP